MAICCSHTKSVAHSEKENIVKSDLCEARIPTKEVCDNLFMRSKRQVEDFAQNVNIELKNDSRPLELKIVEISTKECSMKMYKGKCELTISQVVKVKVLSGNKIVCDVTSLETECVRSVVNSDDVDWQNIECDVIQLLEKYDREVLQKAIFDMSTDMRPRDRDVQFIDAQ